MLGDWMIMAHGFVFAQYDKQMRDRGDNQVGSLNWAMLMATHDLAGTINVVPKSLESCCGSRSPVGALIFLRARPFHRHEIADEHRWNEDGLRVSALRGCDSQGIS